MRLLLLALALTGCAAPQLADTPLVTTPYCRISPWQRAFMPCSAFHLRYDI